MALSGLREVMKVRRFLIGWELPCSFSHQLQVNESNYANNFNSRSAASPIL